MKNKEARENCRWIPPIIGWPKLNFDRASEGDPSLVGTNCIITNKLGNWIAKRAKSIDPTTNNLVELEALQD